MPKSYREGYEIVQLLRLNGAQIKRTERSRYTLRMGHQGRWKVHELSIYELKKRFGKGTTEYEVLRKHPRAHTIAAGE